MGKYFNPEGNSNLSYLRDKGTPYINTSIDSIMSKFSYFTPNDNMGNRSTFNNVVGNYVYLYHTNEYLFIPVYPETIADSQAITYSTSTPLARSAPIYSFSYSGPRTVQVELHLHRDMMYDANEGASNVSLNNDEDYVDKLIKSLQSIALPKYADASKMVNPPMVAVRFGNQIYIKGIVNGSVSVKYESPVLENGKYCQANIAFNVFEVEPYDATIVAQVGSLRGEGELDTVNSWEKRA